jgi:hypothetical protein
VVKALSPKEGKLKKNHTIAGLALVPGKSETK